MNSQQKKRLIAVGFSSVFALGVLSACSTSPKTTVLLESTRSDFINAQNSALVSTYASHELKQANEALASANQAAIKRESEQEIDALAYLAKQKVATAQELAKKRAAEADIKNSAQQRNEMRLDQRTMEANQALLAAEQARIAAANANRQAGQAKADTVAAKRDTDAALAQSAESQRIAAAAQLKAQKLEAQLADLSAKKTERGIVITFGDLLFHTDQSRMTASGMDSAKKLAAVLQDYPQRSVMVEGFTDSTGSRAHNQELSERRSASVKTALENLGIDRNRITMRGYGESYPVASNANADDRRLNRRVEIILSDDSGKIAPR